MIRSPFRILVADPLEATGLELLRTSGAEVVILDGAERPRLGEMIGDFDALVVRSATQVDAALLERASRLRVIGRAGIGVDNVDVATATERGILVVNAPTANVLSAIEHTFALLLALARRVSAADAALKGGTWDRKVFVGQELQGKTLGVIGFGRIGQGVAERARAFEMEVVTHDPYLDPGVAKRLGVELLALDELLVRADVVTLHVPLTEQTRDLLNAKRLARMKEGAMLVNCARGGIVDERALLEQLEAGRLGGAALDVFAKEPPEDLTLVRHPSVVATPHLGAQTREAQERIASEIARMVVAALEGSLAVSAVNLPFHDTGRRGEPFLHLGEQLGRLASGLLEGGFQRLEVALWGIDEGLRTPLAVAVLKGVLTPFLGEAVNFVNAERIAESRGLEVISSVHHRAGDYPQLVDVALAGERGRVKVAGTLFADSDARVVRFESFRLEFRPKGQLLVIENRDVPGVVGRVGTLLGEAGINIAEIHLARKDGAAEAMAVIRLDEQPSPEVLAKLGDLPEVSRVRTVDLGHD